MTFDNINILKNVLQNISYYIYENLDLDYTFVHYKKNDINIYLTYENYNPNITLSLKISNGKDLFVDFSSDMTLQHYEILKKYSIL